MKIIKTAVYKIYIWSIINYGCERQALASPKENVMKTTTKIATDKIYFSKEHATYAAKRSTYKGISGARYSGKVVTGKLVFGKEVKTVYAVKVTTISK